jgi:hypothetical protein
MNATQMGYEFDVGYDFITNFDAPGVEPKEKSTFLTKAQESLVLDILEDNSYNEFNKRTVDVYKSSATILAAAMSAGPYTNSRWATLPQETGPPVRPAIKVVNETAVLTPTANHFYFGQTFSDVKVKPVDDDYYHLNINNPYKKPDQDEIWRMDYGDSGAFKLVYIIEANTTLTSVTVHYYAKPRPIIMQSPLYVVGDGTIDGELFASYQGADLNCLLNEITHREIIDRAVKFAYAALQDEKGFQISSAIEQQNN